MRFLGNAISSLEICDTKYKVIPLTMTYFSLLRCYRQLEDTEYIQTGLQFCQLRKIEGDGASDLRVSINVII